MLTNAHFGGHTRLRSIHTTHRDTQRPAYAALHIYQVMEIDGREWTRGEILLTGEREVFEQLRNQIDMILVEMAGLEPDRTGPASPHVAAGHYVEAGDDVAGDLAEALVNQDEAVAAADAEGYEGPTFGGAGR